MNMTSKREDVRRAEIVKECGRLCEELQNEVQQKVGEYAEKARLLTETSVLWINMPQAEREAYRLPEAAALGVYATVGSLCLAHAIRSGSEACIDNVMMMAHRGAIQLQFKEMVEELAKKAKEEKEK